eukprot:g101.t1
MNDENVQQQPVLKKRRVEGEKKTEKKKEEGSKEVSAESALGSIDITKIMNSDGPVCKCVVLRTDGTAEEVDVDMTPKKQNVTNMLGGRTSFVGQWDDIGVIVCCADQNALGEDAKINKHKLQPPLHKAVVKGIIVLTRSGEEGEPLDFTLKEWQNFLKKDIPEWEVDENLVVKVDGEADQDDEEEEEDGEDEYNPSEGEEDEDDGFDGFIDMLLGRVVQQFVSKHGREPSEEEAQELENALRVKLGGAAPGEEEEEEEEEEEASKEVDNDAGAVETKEPADAKQVLDLLIEEFQKQNGRLPTNEEMKQWIAALKGQEEGGTASAEDKEGPVASDAPSS